MNEANLTPLQHQVLDILLKDTSERKPASAISIVHKISSGMFGSSAPKIAVLNAMNVLRHRGYPICSVHNGFFYARDPESVRKFIDILQEKVDPTLRLIEAMHNTFPNVGKPGSEIKITTTLAVRTPTGVEYRNFEVGEDGKPIIPPDITLL